MHVAVLGAGALGLVYGGLLAKRTSTTVTFVVRPSRAGDAQPVRLEHVDHDAEAVELPKRRDVAEVPGDADVVLLAVRAEQIDDALLALLAPSRASVVVLTPVFADKLAMLEARLGKRVFAAMPSVVAYVRAPGVVRYWLPRMATTLVEEPRPMRAEIDELVRSLHAAGISSRLQLGVEETNAATTVTFMPLAVGLDVAGSVDALLADHDLLALTLAAAREAGELAHALGKPAPWAPLLTKFVGPLTLKIGVSLAERRAPEAVRYVEEHFGRKLHAQNVAMSEAMVRLASDKRVPHDALARLHARIV